MRIVDALSLEKPMSEEMFLARELGIRWNTVSDHELARALRSSRVTLVIVSDPVLYDVILKDAPVKSVVLLQISDEAYTTDRVAQATLAAVRSIFRHYAPATAPVTQRMRAIAGFVGDARTSDVPMRSARPLYASGKAVRQRMADWQTVPIPVQSIPLGYTNAFANAHEENGIAPSERTTPICFRGNRGLAPRVLGLEAASLIPGAAIHIVNQVWSGASAHQSGARDYVEQLRSSRFALVPPGFVNAESFRYYEAILCGALPVEIRVALTHQGIVPFRSPGSIRAWSWRTAVHEVQRMPEADRLSRLAAARTLMYQQFAMARASISKAVEE